MIMKIDHHLGNFLSDSKDLLKDCGRTRLFSDKNTNLVKVKLK